MTDKNQLVELSADIVTAHVANNAVAAGDMSDLIQLVHDGLVKVATRNSDPVPPSVVSVGASIRRDYLVCMICGAKHKTLRRHLKAVHGVTPEQYRKDYGLPATYPTMASEYSERRREIARSIVEARAEQSSDFEPEPKSSVQPAMS